MTVKTEQGAVLIVSLIILLIMTMIGLAGMEITSLEEKMAGSMRDRNIAFQAAETGLLEGENYLDNRVLLPAFDGTDGLYSLAANGAKRWKNVDWKDANAVRMIKGQGFEGLQNPAYIIESLDAAGGGNNLEIGIPTGATNYYRVTARSVGQSGSAEVILQTVFKR